MWHSLTIYVDITKIVLRLPRYYFVVGFSDKILLCTEHSDKLFCITFWPFSNDFKVKFLSDKICYLFFTNELQNIESLIGCKLVAIRSTAFHWSLKGEREHVEMPKCGELIHTIYPII